MTTLIERPEGLPEDAWHVWLSFFAERPLQAPFGAVYPRVSSRGQEEGWSLVSQLKAELARAVEDGITVLPEHIYWEVHTAEDLWERPSLTRLRAAFKAHVFDVVYFYAVDRFAREPFYVDLVMDEARRAEVQVRFIQQHFDETAEGQLLRSVAGYVAKKELYAIKERTNRGKRERVIENGKPYGAGKPPFGYVWAAPISDRRRDKNCFCEEHPEQAAIVRRIFREIAAGRGMRDICRDLMRDGIPTPAGKPTWKTGTVSALVRNEAYVGQNFANRWRVLKKNGKRITVARPREEWVPIKDGVYPPLVTQAQWDATQAVKATNKALAARNNKKPDGFLLRGGFIRCAVCSGSLVSRRYTTGYTSYMCHGNVNGVHVPGGPTRPSVSSEALDSVVWAHVKQLLDDEQFLDAELRRLAESDHVQTDVHAVDVRLVQIDSQLANYARAMATAHADVVALLTEQMNMLSDQRRGLEAERGHIERRGAAVSRARQHVEQLRDRLGPQLAQALEAMPYAERRRTLLALGIRVTVYNRPAKGARGLPPYTVEASLPVDSDQSKFSLLSESTKEKMISLRWTFAGGRGA